MKATNLPQVLRYFDPKKALRGQDLNFWFVARRHSPRSRIEILLRNNNTPSKVLMVGHRGSGKTTELNKLVGELDDKYFTIGFNTLEITGRTNPEYEDLMLTISTQVIRTCISSELITEPLNDKVQKRWRDLQNWWNQIVSGLDFQPSTIQPNVYAELGILLGQVELGIRQSSITRDEILYQVNRQMPELIDRLNWVIDQVQAEIPRRLLLIVEGLDKVDLQSATSIFRDHASTITAPNASMIYTFPIALRHSEHYTTVRYSFPDVHVLPNLATRHKNGSLNDNGFDALKRLILVRMEDELIAEDALNYIVESNGGIPVWLVYLMRSSALFALERNENSDKILLQDARNAVEALSREGITPLTSHDWNILKQRHNDKTLTNDIDTQRLLYNGSLIEYTSGVTWCDAHPALWSLLEED